MKIQIKHSAKNTYEIIENFKYLYNVINVWIKYTIVCLLKKNSALENKKYIRWKWIHFVTEYITRYECLIHARLEHFNKYKT